MLALHEPPAPTHPRPSIHVSCCCPFPLFAFWQSHLSIFKAIAEGMMGHFNHVKAISLHLSSVHVKHLSLCV